MEGVWSTEYGALLHNNATASRFLSGKGKSNIRTGDAKQPNRRQASWKLDMQITPPPPLGSKLFNSRIHSTLDDRAKNMNDSIMTMKK